MGAKRKQKGYRRRLKNDNGHRSFVARICCRLTSLTGECLSVQNVLCISRLSMLMKSVYGCLMGRADNIRTQRFYYVLFPLCICQCSGTGPLGNDLPIFLAELKKPAFLFQLKANSIHLRAQKQKRCIQILFTQKSQSFNV